MAELIITLADGRKLRHPLGTLPAVIGRDAGCDIPIDDPSASRRHARFSPTPAGYLVEDLGSKNGTLVNDKPHASHLLKDGDRVLIGSAMALYRESELPSSHSVVITDELPESHATRYVSREQQLLLSQQRLQMIYELSERLTTVQDQNQLLKNAMEITFEMLHFERGAIGIRRRDRRSLDWPVINNLAGAGGELTISRTLLSRALEYGERAIFTDDGTSTTDPTVSMVQHGIRSAMCVPLVHNNETLGVIYGDRITTSASYTDEDMDFLAGIAQQVTIGLVNCRLVEDQREMVRLKHGMDLARTIQTGLFPSCLPNRPGLKIAAVNDPGDRISGDYYDVIELGDGRVWCLIADVTGEGVPAALLMANLQAAVRVTIDQTDDPGALLGQWNNLICRNTDSSKFITCLLALIDLDSRTIRFASAGHCTPFIVRPAGEAVEELASEAGFPLGVVDETGFETATVELGPDPFLFFCYTDGVIEAMNPDGGYFGVDRLREILTELRDQNPQSLVKQVRKHVTRFTAEGKQSDDITLLAAQVG